MKSKSANLARLAVFVVPRSGHVNLFWIQVRKMSKKPFEILEADHSIDRTFGLDICRTIAVLSVIFGHMLQHSSPNSTVASMGFIAIFGVDLFFCLSGFLIGRILLMQSEKWVVQKERGLFKFWYRRWMRTLPLYYFFLIISLKYDWRGETTLIAQFSYLFFAENFAWPMREFYGVTWSLAVEEWFYFLFPLLMLTLMGFGCKARRSAEITIACFLLMPPLMRAVLPGNPYDFKNFDEGVRHVVVFRLDSIGFGVTIAALYCWHRRVFNLIGKFWWVTISLSVVCMVLTKQAYFGFVDSPWVTTFYLSILGFCFALLVPFFFRIKATRFALLNRFIRFTSQISYSIYLGHIFCFIFGMNILKRFGIFDVVYPNPWLVYPFFVGLIYLVAFATYYGIEKPFLVLRDKNLI